MSSFLNIILHGGEGADVDGPNFHGKKFAEFRYSLTEKFRISLLLPSPHPIPQLSFVHGRLGRLLC